MKFGMKHVVLALHLGCVVASVESGNSAVSSVIAAQLPPAFYQTISVAQRHRAEAGKSLLSSLAKSHRQLSVMHTEDSRIKIEAEPPTKIYIGDTVEHDKSKGGGYEKGSPLYDKQEAFKDGRNPDIEYHEGTCAWMCALLLVSCLSMGVGGCTSQFGGREYQGRFTGIKIGGILGLISVLLTSVVIIYLSFMTSILQLFLDGKPVGFWCSFLCVWALVQVFATLMFLVVLSCLLMVGASTVNLLAEAQRKGLSRNASQQNAN